MDVLVRITAANICGSDLHMYEGRTSFGPGRTFGHENLGDVVETGPAASKVKVGERVVLPFNIACGFCKNCDRGFTNYCLTMQPEPQLDIFSTGWHAAELAVVYPGDSVVIYGAGPVGLPQDPGAPDKLAQQGQVAFDYGNYWFRRQTMGSGQCPVNKYNRALRDLSAGGKASPSFIVSQELPLDQAPGATKTLTAAKTAGPKPSSIQPTPGRPEWRFEMSDLTISRRWY